MGFSYTAQSLAEYVQQGLSFRLQEKEYAVTLVGFKGFLESSPGVGVLSKNEPDLYDDTLSALWHEELSIRHRGFRCTLEPGRKYTEITPHPEGAARLPECRLLQFKWGTHHGRPALVPADLDVVMRDANGNYRIDPHERVHVGNFQVRIHSGGTDPTSIGGWSAGCIAISGGEKGEPWRTFHRICRKHPFARFNLVIGRGYDFYQWLLLKKVGRLDEFRATVHVGSKDVAEGGNVCKLQKLLNERYEAKLKPDGDFGLRTLEAFLEAQRSIGVARPKAVCSRPQWERLQGKFGPYADEGETHGFFD